MGTIIQANNPRESSLLLPFFVFSISSPPASSIHSNSRTDLRSVPAFSPPLATALKLVTIICPLDSGSGLPTSAPPFTPASLQFTSSSKHFTNSSQGMSLPYLKKPLIISNHRLKCKFCLPLPQDQHDISLYIHLTSSLILLQPNRSVFCFTLSLFLLQGICVWLSYLECSSVSCLHGWFSSFGSQLPVTLSV